ncbi:MAG TPA: hypothetical protein VK962_07810 [Actinomycetota bacterium]|nr:hypothetical protein [Actinomycetota bacterium]
MLAVVLLVAVSQGPPEPERARLDSFSSGGLSFTYLSTLHQIPGGDLDGLDVAEMTLTVGGAEDAAWREVFAIGEGDLVVLFGRDQSYLVAQGNLGVYEASIVERYRAAGIEVPQTRTLSVDGLPALSSLSRTMTPSGLDVQIRTTEIFAGGTVYVFVCQGAPDGRGELMAACDAILRSVTIQPRDPTLEWETLSSRSGSVRLSVPPGWQETDELGRLTELAASLPTSEGTTAARLRLDTVRLRRPVPTALYADAVADRLKRYLVGRRTLRIDGRRAEMLRFEDKDAGGVFYVFVEGRTAYAVRFDVPIGDQSFALLRPTMDAIATSLDLRSR